MKFKQVSEFKETKIGDVCPFVYGKGLPKEKRIKGNVPVYGSNGIVGFHNESFLQGPCIIIGRKGSIGKIHYSKTSCWPIDTTFYIEENKNYHLKFIFYLLKFLNLENMDSDTSVPGLNRNAAHDVKIEIPEKTQQVRISQILENLDLNIENLQNQNKILEQITQAIFKSWFVDFDGQTEFEDSELGTIPKGWTVKQFGEVYVITDYTANGSFAGLKKNVTYSYVPDHAILVRQVDFKNNWNGNYVYVDKHSYDFLKKSFLKPNDIMISNIGANYGTVFMVPDLGKPMTGAPNVLIVKTEDFNKEFAYSYLLSESGRRVIRSIVTGSAVPKFNKTDFRNHLFIYPNKNHLCDFHKSTFSIIQLILKNKIQIKLLKQSRDSLLPKLMSGEIRV